MYCCRAPVAAHSGPVTSWSRREATTLPESVPLAVTYARCGLLKFSLVGHHPSTRVVALLWPSPRSANFEVWLVREASGLSGTQTRTPGEPVALWTAKSGALAALAMLRWEPSQAGRLTNPSVSRTERLRRPTPLT